ncbi:transcriptional repressor [uncultured Oscillibacter sp.]|uniref:Fur family transcriptional regulator n=1 Tax=uncultured Oscillibacter sp. TaxID=876091 RepID=UPI00280543A9|nr:transcriptional repressor [uncultured Oscillibacter sp.]
MATLRRYSRQRERIYQAVHASWEHPSAQMVYDLLREELPRLSLGTVYRNLHQMAQEGMLQELEGPTARFDACLAPHAHIRCTCCGRVMDLSALEEPAPVRSAAEAGWQVERYSLMLEGICPACAGKDHNEF